MYLQKWSFLTKKEVLMDKKVLVAIFLSVGTVWLLNRYTNKSVQNAPQGAVAVGQRADAVPGQPIKVATSEELYKPLQTDVLFDKQKGIEQEMKIPVQTKYCEAVLSSHGATLISLDFKEHTGKADKPLRTVSGNGGYDLEQRKKGCFLLAFEKEAPYVYKCMGSNEKNDVIEVAFKTENESWEISKTYVFYKDSYKIDLILGFQAKNPAHIETIRPRLFFAAPIVGEIVDDSASVCSWNEQKEAVDKIDKGGWKDTAWFWTASKPLFGAEDRYFVHALVGDASHFVQRAYVRQWDSKNISPILEGPVLTTPKSEWKLSFYMGPKVIDHLHDADDRLEDLLSFGWLSWVCKLLLKLLSYIYDFVGNFGVAILIMTLLLKLPFTPLSIYSRKQMEHYQYYLPSINKIRTKFRHDLKMQQEELMKFYKDHNLSPTTQMVGCLPLLIQMPILFSLYRVLNNYLDLYQAPFFGWIVDLSSKDPFYVLPVMMGLSMLWQQKLTPASDGKQKVIMYFMALIMTVVFANFPAGLVLYWLANNVLTIGEDYVRKYFFK